MMGWRQTQYGYSDVDALTPAHISLVNTNDGDREPKNLVQISQNPKINKVRA